MLSPTLPNPFIVHRADDTLELPPGDVPELRAEAIRKAREAVQDAARTRSPVGLAVVGEPGSGKSHLLGHLRQLYAADRRTVFCVASLFKVHAGNLWRATRRKLVADLLRPHGPESDCADGLLRLLANRFPDWAQAARGTGGRLTWQWGRAKAAEPLLKYLPVACPARPELENGLAVEILPVADRGRQRRGHGIHGTARRGASRRPWPH